MTFLFAEIERLNGSLENGARMPGQPAGSRPRLDIMAIRAAKIAIVGIVAAFFTIVAIGNIVDFETNHEFVRHVLSMDTTFKSPNLMWRAVDDPTLQTVAYWIIIFWEGLTAATCWLGVFSLTAARTAPAQGFDRARTLAIVGLLSGVVLYGFGFLVIASEWFAMWQSDDWNAQATAGMFTLVLLAALIFVGAHESSPGHAADDETA